MITSDTKPFIRQTAETATFAVREFFRPLVSIPRFLFNRFIRVSVLEEQVAIPAIKATNQQNAVTIEDAKAILREGLMKRRGRERLLLTQCIVAAFISLLAVAIDLQHLFQIDSEFYFVLVLASGCFASWEVYRIVKNREELIELKTLHRLIKSVDQETAERLIKQVMWGKSNDRRGRKKTKTLR